MVDEHETVRSKKDSAENSIYIFHLDSYYKKEMIYGIILHMNIGITTMHTFGVLYYKTNERTND